jgi:tetratricopeptide (TPR) repeat protein
MKPFSRLFTFLAIVFAVALHPVGAVSQEIPLGWSDQQKLQTLLAQAKEQLGSHPDDLNWLKTAGIASHQLATLKVKSASEDAVGYLKRVTELDTTNAEMLAYLGSAYAMLGRDSSFVVGKVSNVNKGLAALDRAVKKDGSDLGIRFIRASVSYNLPAMFSRKKTAEDDYLFYVDAAKGGAKVSADHLAEAYYKLGQLNQDKDQKEAARVFYQQAQQASPRSGWAQEAGKAIR